MDKNFYTKLSYEHKDPEDFGPTVVEQKITAWDLGMDEMVDMFHTLMIGATYSEEVFAQGLLNWLEEYHPEMLENYDNK